MKRKATSANSDAGRSLLIDPVNVTKPRDIRPLSVGLRDAARLLGVSERHPSKLAIAGQVPSVMIGGRRVFRLESLDQWLRELETGGKQTD